MKNVLVLPGWMTSIDLYKDSKNFDICIGKLNEKCFYADCVVGLSLGALVVLRDTEKIKGKIILINPPLPKRNLLSWFGQWCSFIKHEGLFFERQHFTKNPFKFILAISSCLKLLLTDFEPIIRNHKENITILRGVKDDFFCDNKAVEFFKSNKVQYIEFNGGHNLSQEMEITLHAIITL